MNLSRVLVLGGALLLVAACGGTGKGGPDGGTDRVVCTEGLSTLAVTVKDAAGNPVKGATVTARHTGNGGTVTSTTNEQGVATAITSEVPAGTVQIKATSGTQVSNTVQVEWICGECTCTATPANVLLTFP